MPVICYARCWHNYRLRDLVSDKHAIKPWLLPFLGEDVAAQDEVLSLLSSPRRPPAKVGWQVLVQLLKAGEFDAFDKVCEAVGRAWSPTPGDFNERIAAEALRGDPRWLVSLYRHKLTQTDYGLGGDGFSLSRSSWLRILVDRAPRFKNGWDNLLATVKAVPTGWSGGYGNELLKGARPDIPDDVKQVLRETEAVQMRRRQWCLSSDAEALRDLPCPNPWQYNETPLTHAIAVADNQMLTNPQDIHATLGRLRQSLEIMMALGGDGGALHRSEPALLKLGDIETMVRKVDPTLVYHVVEIFDLLSRGVDMTITGQGCNNSWMWQSHKMSIASGLASVGAVSLARRSIELGCAPDHVDALGRGWLWHAWSSGCVDVPACPSDQLTLRTSQGQSLLHCVVNSFSDADIYPLIVPQTPILTEALANLIAAGLSADDAQEGFQTPREMAHIASPEIFQALIDAESLAISMKVAQPHSLSPSRRF